MSFTWETIYAELDDALADVANRSFYDDCTVTPVPGGWQVEDERGARMSDEWTWTYATGVQHTDSVCEVSRLHADYEYYSEAGHIRYNLGDSVELLEARTHSVTFAYAVVEVDPSDPDYMEDADSAGWILAANHWPLDEWESE